MKFWNHQTIEKPPAVGCYDGAVVEISTNGGGSWTRLEAQVLTDPYDGLVNSGCSNPIAGTNAWCGDPQDWTKSDRGPLRVRGADGTVPLPAGDGHHGAREGWYIDDVTVQACGATPASTTGSRAATCRSGLSRFRKAGEESRTEEGRVRANAPGFFLGASARRPSPRVQLENRPAFQATRH